MAYGSQALIRPDGIESVGNLSVPIGLDGAFDVYRTALEADDRMVQQALTLVDPGDVLKLTSEARVFRVNALRAVSAISHTALRVAGGSVISSATGSVDGRSTAATSRTGSVGSSVLRGQLRASCLGPRTALSRLPDGLCYLKGAVAGSAEMMFDAVGRNPTTAKLLSRPAAWFNSYDALNRLRVTGAGLSRHVKSTGSKGTKLGEHFLEAAAGRDWPVGSLGEEYVARWPGRLRSSDWLVKVTLGGRPKEPPKPLWVHRREDGGGGVCFYCAVEQGVDKDEEKPPGQCWAPEGPDGFPGFAQDWLRRMALVECKYCEFSRVEDHDIYGRVVARCAAQWLVSGGREDNLTAGSKESVIARARCVTEHVLPAEMDARGVTCWADTSRMLPCGLFVCEGHQTQCGTGGVVDLAVVEGASLDRKEFDMSRWLDMLKFAFDEVEFKNKRMIMTSYGSGWTSKYYTDGSVAALLYYDAFSTLRGFVPVPVGLEAADLLKFRYMTMDEMDGFRAYPVNGPSGVVRGVPYECSDPRVRKAAKGFLGMLGSTEFKFPSFAVAVGAAK